MNRLQNADESVPTVPGDASHELLEPVIDRVGDTVSPENDWDDFQRDPDFVAASLPLLRALDGYFGTELRGWENIPEGEPVLFVGNHSGGMMTLDPVSLMLRWIEERGAAAPIYGLTYDLLFAPGIGSLLRRLGCLPASQANARRALDKGASLIVFPGGDYEVFRPWTERNQIQFGGRMGFVELALRAGVRIVPMTIHGAHESTVVLTRGRRFARRIGLDRLRVKVFPFIWNFPLGVTPAFIPSIPLPAKRTVSLAEPIDWRHIDPEDADDPEILQACYDEVTGVMQESLDEMARERPYPLLSRAADWLPRW
ncbi:MAG: acyltransferase family protein [Deltaproteobacteria bacterium]|nr:acyltransferase family protein [Deltaproteobacteria bacterium]